MVEFGYTYKSNVAGWLVRASQPNLERGSLPDFKLRPLSSAIVGLGSPIHKRSRLDQEIQYNRGPEKQRVLQERAKNKETVIARGKYQNDGASRFGEAKACHLIQRPTI